MPDDDHGKGHAGADPHGKAITNKTFQVVSDAFGMKTNESKTNTKELLEEEKQN